MRVESTTRQAASRPPCDDEGHDATAAALLTDGQRVLRMAGQARVVDALHARVRLQPARELERAGAVRAHPQLQRLQALEDDPGVERRERRTGVAQERGERIMDQCARPEHRPAQHPPLPVEILGGRVNDEVGAQFAAAAAAPACRSSCPPPARRRADAQAAPAPRCRRSRSAGLEGVSRNSRRVFGLQRCLPGGGLGPRDEGGLDTEPRQPVVEELHGGPEQAPRSHDVVAAAHQAQNAWRGSPTCPRPWPRSTRAPSSAARRSCSASTVGLV